MSHRWRHVGAVVVVLLLSAAFGMRGVRAAQVVGVTSASPTTVQVGVGTVVTVTSKIDDASLILPSVSLQRLDSAGRVIGNLGTLLDNGTGGDAVAGDKTFTIRTTIFETSASTVRLRVAAGFLGKLTNAFSTVMTVNATGTAVGMTITSPTNMAYVNTSPVRVDGTLGDPAATVTINGIPAVVTGGGFTASVPVLEGTNTLTAVATNANGTNTTASVQVTLDTTPPNLAITTPDALFTTTSAAITVSGIVNDIVVGTVNDQQAQVAVNGVAAQVANRTFLASNVPLTIGSNTIQARATDRAGNSKTIELVVTRTAPGAVPTLQLVSGNGQTAAVGSVLTQPLVVGVANAQGQPVTGVPVVFKVTENSGGLITAGTPEGSVVVLTNPQGRAQAQLKLGSRAGVGNNVVEATSAGFAGTALFNATGTATAATQIVVDTGNGQTGVVDQTLPLPFIAIVTDEGFNRLGGVPVTFTVKQGGGTISGQATFNTTTDSDGRVAALLKLGKQEGQDNNVVEVTFGGNAGQPAAFLATAKVPGDPAQTRIAGVVLDNSNQPIPEVTMRLFLTHHGTGLPQEVATPVKTNVQGHFNMLAPVGTFKLMADGATGTGGPWPAIEFDMTTVAGQVNDVGLPIYLPALDTVNKLCVTPTTGGTLTLPNVPGFSLTIAAGGATFPGGSKTGCVTVTPVNGDKVPMSPGFGQQPRFVVTIQPVGTVFNPAAVITLPNVDGLAPRAVTEMYSYDHDLASFVSIGTGTVSDDGSIIKSDPGVGVIKAGWHCGGNPNTVGSAGTCPLCQKCQGSSCVVDPSLNGKPVPDDKCQVCTNGSAAAIPLNPLTIKVSKTFEVPHAGVEKINEGLDELKKVGVIASVNLLTLTGEVSTQECCGKTTGKANKTEGKVSGNFGGVDVKVKVWPPGPIPSFEREFSVGLVTVTATAEFVGGIFLGFDASVSGELGYREDPCSETAADKQGCFFGTLNTTLNLKASAEAGGEVAVIFGGADCEDCTKISLSGRLGADANLPLKISSVGYNASNCSEGLKGGVFTFDDATFKVSATISGQLHVLGVDVDVEESWEFLTCSANLTTGITCQVGG